MKIVGNNVEKHEAQLIAGYTRQCIKLLRRKEYELNLPAGAADAAYTRLEVKNRARSSSSACADFIRINLGYWQVGNWTHTEYASFNKHPTIGEIMVSDKYDHWRIAVAHEVAHYVQYRYCPRVHRFKKTWRKPHGECFKQVYGYLRRDLVNPIIEEKLSHGI